MAALNSLVSNVAIVVLAAAAFHVDHIPVQTVMFEAVSTHAFQPGLDVNCAETTSTYSGYSSPLV
jgi:hypothetical protein